MSKKVLIISPLFYPLFGGMEVQVMMLAKEYVKLGYKVDVLTEQTKIEFPREETIEGFRVIRVRNVGDRNILAFLGLGYDLIKFLLSNRSNYNFIIIRTFTFYGAVVGMLKFLRLITVKTFITAENGGEEDGISDLRKWPFYKVVIFFFNQNDFLNSICKDNYIHFSEMGFDKSKLTKIYNGVETENYLRSMYPKKINSFLFIGRLVEGKGLRELLKAFKSLSKKNPLISLNIAGDGPLKDLMVRFIDKNKELRIKYWGYVDGEKKKTLFEKSDCLVLPSYSEGFPVSVLEAMAYKKVVVCSDVSDIKELFADVIYVCKRKSVSDLKEKMEKAMTEYKQDRVNYDKYITKFSISNVAKEIEQMLI